MLLHWKLSQILYPSKNFHRTKITRYMVVVWGADCLYMPYSFGVTVDRESFARFIFAIWQSGENFLQ